jgi:AcrR family transcriptional regulator
MGISERKEREKQEMRKNIIDAAMHMFTHDGYENASIRKIADKIEYSPGTIYLYYKDKDELLYDVQAECFSKLYDVFKKEATAKDPFKRLEQICHSYINFGLNNPEIYDLMFMMKGPMNKVHENDEWDNADDCLDHLTKCIQECIEKGLVHFDNVTVGILSIWSFGHGLLSLQLCGRMKITRMDDEQNKQLIYATVSNYLNTIKK